jgi:deoxyribose-phosphate aldolase
MWVGKYIDHTLLKPEATLSEIEQLCDQAIEFSAASVCTNSYWTEIVASKLRGKSPVPCAVVGFPLGAQRKEIKALETSMAVADGAQEIDMVINIGALKCGLDKDVVEDIEAVVKAAHGKAVKVILETCLLSKDEIIRACSLAVIAGADFVKTSTGFSSAGASVEHVGLMRETVDRSGKKIKVKASGGIRTLEHVKAMILAGADRIGCSKGVEIVKELLANPIDEPKYERAESEIESLDVEHDERKQHNDSY